MLSKLDTITTLKCKSEASLATKHLIKKSVITEEIAFIQHAFLGGWKDLKPTNQRYLVFSFLR